jgi:hypothetical protein
LFCFRQDLLEVAASQVSSTNRDRINPLNLIDFLNRRLITFFREELGVNIGRSYFLAHLDLVVRLKHLEALVQSTFRGPKDPILLLSESQAMMTNRCPFVPHGLSFLLGTSCSRLQTISYLSKLPGLIQFWNQNIDPLRLNPTFSPEILSKMTKLLVTLFAQAPDCVVHPASQQAVLDLTLLSGVVSSEYPARVERSLSILSVASAVRSSRRFIQSLISTTPATPPVNCPTLLLNENKGQTLRGIAAAYFAHVCSLDIPFFDTSLTELRTLFFFRCFEEQCKSFKSLTAQAEAVTVESGHIAGQWYRADPKLFTPAMGTPRGTTTATGRSTSGKTSTRTTSTRTTGGRKRRNAGFLKESLYFFMGVIVEAEEARKPTKVPSPVADRARLVPLRIVAQMGDLKRAADAMAQVALDLDEGQKLATAEGIAPPPREPEPKFRRRPPKGKTVEIMAPAITLKDQAQVANRNAELHWIVAVRLGETVFDKSNRFATLLGTQKNVWPGEVRMGNVDISSAGALSHLFNVDFGIRETDPQLANWLAMNAGAASSRLSDEG